MVGAFLFGQRAAVAVEAKPLLAAEAKRNQTAAGAANLERYKNPSSLKNEKTKPVAVEKTVAQQFDVSQGYVYAAPNQTCARFWNAGCWQLAFSFRKNVRMVFLHHRGLVQGVSPKYP